ncbi:molybdopterin synthase small subunit [Polystyrenella longa]|uniref:Molybdopterin synthase sulfur carrier subunit n=1 Tax=Polystyrenella longa TaxID=2528007 RepID=A0A518CR66_9PLAN|nr:MoaD/ThiS family protein [Polystyrenella longa]QDU81721.1 molybdopterin synthase small subunit [Polystyrenella longa]
MKVHLTLFAAAQELAGAKTIELDFEQEQINLHELRSALTEKFPAMSALAPHLLFAAGTDYLPPESIITDGDQLVCFPPVSGG